MQFPSECNRKTYNYNWFRNEPGRSYDDEAPSDVGSGEAAKIRIAVLNIKLSIETVI